MMIMKVNPYRIIVSVFVNLSGTIIDVSRILWEDLL